MKIAVGLVCLVAMALLDGVLGQTKLQLSSENQKGRVGEINLNSLTEDAPRERRRGKSLCQRALGGRCTKSRIKRCWKRFPYRTARGSPWCGKFHSCCHNDKCVGNGGTKFAFAGKAHCVLQQYTNWTDARALCEDIGMTMAQPVGLDAVGLSTKLASMRKVEQYFWLGGQGDGSDQVYLDGTVIANDSSLWYEEPGVEVEDCTVIYAYDRYTEPLSTEDCSDYDLNSVLCQQASTRRSLETIGEELYPDHWNIESDADEDNENIQEDQLGENQKDYESDEDEAFKVE